MSLRKFGTPEKQPVEVDEKDLKRTASKPDWTEEDREELREELEK